MARRQRDSNHQATPPAPPPKGVDTLGLATLAGTIAVLVISFSNMRSIDRLAGDVGQLETRIDRVGDRVAQAPAAAPAQPAQQPAQTPPRRRGPDPESVYEVRTANAPYKGPTNAPVVIAEFSDFQ